MNVTELQATKTQIMKIVHSVLQICKEGKGFDRMALWLHKDMVMVSAVNRRTEGKAACLQYYEDLFSKIAISRLDICQEQIGLWPNIAVVTYHYDCIWTWQGKTVTDDGREILFFVKEDLDWQIVWRVQIAESRKIEAGVTEEVHAQNKEVRQICLDLMKTSFACYLTTLDSDGFPQMDCMNNLRCVREYPFLAWLFESSGNEFLVYLSTSMLSGKAARIRANPKASVYFCVPDQFIGLMVGGTIEIITDKALKDRIWQKGWTMYYPDGPDGLEYGILRLVPTVARGWLQSRSFEFKI